jgi:hypothetical protein
MFLQNVCNNVPEGTAMKTSNTTNFLTTGDFGIQSLIEFFKKYTY